ncbi:hypothetical protein HRG_012521 [Hirsutella rhossiliensis]
MGLAAQEHRTSKASKLCRVRSRPAPPKARRPIWLVRSRIFMNPLFQEGAIRVELSQLVSNEFDPYAVPRAIDLAQLLQDPEYTIEGRITSKTRDNILGTLGWSANQLSHSQETPFQLRLLGTTMYAKYYCIVCLVSPSSTIWSPSANESDVFRNVRHYMTKRRYHLADSWLNKLSACKKKILQLIIRRKPIMDAIDAHNDDLIINYWNYMNSQWSDIMAGLDNLRHLIDYRSVRRISRRIPALCTRDKRQIEKDFIQTNHREFRSLSRPTTARLAYMQLFVAALRYFPFLSLEPPLQDTEGVGAQVDRRYVGLLCRTAKKLGFTNTKVDKGCKASQKRRRPIEPETAQKRLNSGGPNPPLEPSSVPSPLSRPAGIKAVFLKKKEKRLKEKSLKKRLDQTEVIQANQVIPVAETFAFEISELAREMDLDPEIPDIPERQSVPEFSETFLQSRPLAGSKIDITLPTDLCLTGMLEAHEEITSSILPQRQAARGEVGQHLGSTDSPETDNIEPPLRNPLRKAPKTKGKPVRQVTTKTKRLVATQTSKGKGPRRLYQKDFSRNSVVRQQKQDLPTATSKSQKSSIVNIARACRTTQETVKETVQSYLQPAAQSSTKFAVPAPLTESDFEMLAELLQDWNGGPKKPPSNQDVSPPKQFSKASPALSDSNELAADLDGDLQLPDVNSDDGLSPPGWAPSPAEWSGHFPGVSID